MKLIAVACLLAALPAVIATDHRLLVSKKSKESKGNHPTSTPIYTSAPTNTEHPTWPPFYAFSLGEPEDCATDPGRLAEIVADLGGNMESDFSVVQDLIPLNRLRAIRDHADSVLEMAIRIQQHQAAGIDLEQDLEQDLDQLPVKERDLNADANILREDFRFELSPTELATFVGLDSFRSIYAAFKDYAPESSVARIVVRRTDLNGNKYIHYHNDGDTAVMHMLLNEDNFIGGNLVYLNKKGATKVESKPGAATLHKDKIVHGITPINGTRYILILLSDNTPQDGVVRAL